MKLIMLSYTLFCVLNFSSFSRLTVNHSPPSSVRARLAWYRKNKRKEIELKSGRDLFFAIHRDMELKSLQCSLNFSICFASLRFYEKCAAQWQLPANHTRYAVRSNSIELQKKLINYCESSLRSSVVGSTYNKACKYNTARCHKRQCF
jgi:hypothetical protein